MADLISSIGLPLSLHNYVSCMQHMMAVQGLWIIIVAYGCYEFYGLQLWDVGNFLVCMHSKLLYVVYGKNGCSIYN